MHWRPAAARGDSVARDSTLAHRAPFPASTPQQASQAWLLAQRCEPDEAERIITGALREDLQLAGLYMIRGVLAATSTQRSRKPTKRKPAAPGGAAGFSMTSARAEPRDPSPESGP